MAHSPPAWSSWRKIATLKPCLLCASFSSQPLMTIAEVATDHPGRRAAQLPQCPAISPCLLALVPNLERGPLNYRVRSRLGERETESPLFPLGSLTNCSLPVSFPDSPWWPPRAWVRPQETVGGALFPVVRVPQGPSPGSSV